MKIRLNGDEVMLEGPCTIGGLLASRRLDGRPCAVEINAGIVPKREHEHHEIVDGDVVEIVTLVGGG